MEQSMTQVEDELAPAMKPSHPSPAALTPRVPGGRSPNFMEEVARQKLAQPPEWDIVQWERIGPIDVYHGVIVTGAIPRILTRGKRKGQRSWSHIKRSDMLKTIVTPDDETRAQIKYEASTGNCHNCGGGGKQWHGWSAAHGTRYIVCRRCKGDGIAPTNEMGAEPKASHI